jgi:hypothetical protein
VNERSHRELGDHDDPGEKLSVELEYVPRKCSDVLELDMGDGVIIYSRESDLVHHLNFSAGLVWQLCEGNASVEELARDFAVAYRLELNKVRSELAVVVAEFDTLGLVTDSRE